MKQSRDEYQYHKGLMNETEEMRARRNLGLQNMHKWPAESIEVEDITPKLNTLMKWVMLGVLVVILFTWILVQW